MASRSAQDDNDDLVAAFERVAYTSSKTEGGTGLTSFRDSSMVDNSESRLSTNSVLRSRYSRRTSARISSQRATDASVVEESGGFEGVIKDVDKPALTVKAIVAGIILGTLNSFLILYYGLKIGVTPSLNIIAGLGGFLLLRAWTKCIPGSCFTKQENAVVQTTAVACASLANTGFSSGLLAMSPESFEVVGNETLGNVDGPGNTVDLTFDVTLMWCLAVGFFGFFLAFPLRKNMIIDQRLTFPSGTCTAVIIDAMHDGANTVGHALVSLYSFITVFVINMIVWIFDGLGSFPLFGTHVRDTFNWSIDFDLSQSAIGLLLSPRVNFGILLGAIIGYGVMWPSLKTRSGDCTPYQMANQTCPYWFDDDTVDSPYLGSYGYLIFSGLGVMISDGIWTAAEILALVYCNVRKQLAAKEKKQPDAKVGDIDADVKILDELFLADKRLPTWLTFAGYAVFGTTCVLILHHSFGVDWYQTVVAIAIIPFFAVAIMTGVGISDWNVSSAFGKLLMFGFGAWNSSTGEIVPALAVCMVTIAGCSAAADLMQDFKTGYLLGAQPSQMFVAQMIGACAGIVVAPACFALLGRAFVFPSDGPLPGIYGPIYRILALITTNGGSSALPDHIFTFLIGSGVATFIINAVSKVIELNGVDKRRPFLTGLIPLPMAVGIGMLIPPGTSLEMALGGLAAAVWRRWSPKLYEVKAFIAAGAIAGAGVAVLIQVFLTIAGAKAPVTITY